MMPYKFSFTTILAAMITAFLLATAGRPLFSPAGLVFARSQTPQAHQEHNTLRESSAPHEHEHRGENHTESEEDHEDHKNTGLHEDEGDGEAEEFIHLGPGQIREFGIQTAPAAPGEIHLQTELTGEIVPDPDRLAHIVPRVTGLTREIRKRTGDTTAAGEILAVIESRELADIKSEYLTAEKRLELASANFKREKRLWEQKITPEQDFLDAKTAMAEADIQLYRARQKLLALGFDREYVAGLPDQEKVSLTRYNIRSPMDGVVIRRNLALGEIIGPESDIFVVADLSTVWVNLTVYQKDLGKVAQGRKVTITADKIKAQTRGAIDYVSPVIQEATRTATARVILANPDGLWRPGLFVTGKVETNSIPADIVVPQTAIQTIHNKPTVFVKKDHGFEPAAVTTGKRNTTQVEIVSGLTPGTEIAVTRTFMLKAELNKEAIGGHNH